MSRNILLEAKKDTEGKLLLEGGCLIYESKNRNGRIYSNPNMDKNIAHGELNHPHCFTPETKVSFIKYKTSNTNQLWGYDIGVSEWSHDLTENEVAVNFALLQLCPYISTAF